MKLLLTIALLLLLSPLTMAQSRLASTAASKEILSLIRAKDYDTALEKAEAQTEALPNSAEAFYWLGSVNGMLAQTSSIFSKLGYAKGVRKAFERAAQLDPKMIEVRLGLIQFHLQAPGIAGGDEDLVPALVQQISAIDKGAGFRAQAIVKLIGKDPNGAKQFYRQALAFNPADVDALSQMVGTLDPVKDVAEIEALLKAASEKAPTDPRVQYQKGKWAALSGKDLEAGLVLLDQIAQITPEPDGISMPGLHWRRAQILEKLGRKADAIAALQRSLQLDGSTKEVKADLERLRKS